MNKIKNIIIVLVVLLLTGCTKDNYAINTINYNLTIDDVYHEEIIFTLPGNAYELAKDNEDEEYTNLEYHLLYNEIEPINSNHDFKYIKNINKARDKVVVDLKYNYSESDFMHANYIMNCFENYNIDSKNDYFEIVLSGEFYCLNDSKISINVNSNHPVIESNGIKENNTYTWQIDNYNYNNVYIKHKIKRDYNDMAEIVYNEEQRNDLWGTIRNLLLIVGAVLALIFINKLSKKQDTF